MKRIKDFLSKEIPVRKIPKAIAIVFLVKYSWLILTIPLILYMALTSGFDMERQEMMSKLFASKDAFDELVYAAPILEEIQFRLPLAVFAWLKLPLEAI